MLPFASHTFQAIIPVFLQCNLRYNLQCNAIQIYYYSLFILHDAGVGTTSESFILHQVKMLQINLQNSVSDRLEHKLHVFRVYKS